MNVAGLALGLVMGLSLGLLGGGGSTLTVPIFVYLLGFEPKAAIAASLAVVSVTSLAGAVGHWRAGNVAPRTAIAFGPIAMCGAFLGARLATRIPGAVQLALFAGIMLASAYFMARGRRGRAGGPAERAGGSAEGAGQGADRRASWLTVPAGLAVGLVTGIVGVGGGFMIVPALVLLARAPMKEAVGTSLLVITMNAAAGFAGYVGRIDVPWAHTVAFTALAVAGILLGAHLIRYVPQETLRRAFAVFLVLMGLFILYRNRGVVPGLGPAPAAAATNRPNTEVTQ